MVRPLVTALNVGRISYATGQQLQQHLAQQPTEEVARFRNYLILQEFNPVYTIGIRTKDYTDADEQKLRALGADFYRTNRGGLITFHGPGQLVAYPVVHLKHFQPSMRWYVHSLERMVIDACERMGVRGAKTTEDTGIWVGDNKICAIGVHGSRYVTTHGIGLNCCTDLKWFEHIVPCGIVGKGVTTLSKQLGKQISVDDAAPVLCESFASVFNCEVQVTDSPPVVQDMLAKAALA